MLSFFAFALLNYTCTGILSCSKDESTKKMPYFFKCYLYEIKNKYKNVRFCNEKQIY